MKKFIRRGISYLRSHGYDIATVRNFELAAANAADETEIESLIAEITNEIVPDDSFGLAKNFNKSNFSK